jgi:16S rRNA (uracil1498-N3)-methyltransferase
MVGEAAHHIGKVLRAQPGQVYELSDGEKVRLGTIEHVERDAIVFALSEEILAAPSRLRIWLLLGVVKFDRFEWAIEKATELGVTEIIPLIAERSEKALVAAAAKRMERWKKIALESAQQSRRLKPPDVLAPMKVADALRGSTAGIKLLLSEKQEAKPLRRVMPTGGDNSDALAIALAIGPEGGWTEREFELARASQFAEVSLGAAILRTETAVVAALAAIHYALGD